MNKLKLRRLEHRPEQICQRFRRNAGSACRVQELERHAPLGGLRVARECATVQPRDEAWVSGEVAGRSGTQLTNLAQGDLAYIDRSRTSDLSECSDGRRPCQG